MYCSLNYFLANSFRNLTTNTILILNWLLINHTSWVNLDHLISTADIIVFSFKHKDINADREYFLLTIYVLHIFCINLLR